MHADGEAHLSLSPPALKRTGPRAATPATATARGKPRLRRTMGVREALRRLSEREKQNKKRDALSRLFTALRQQRAHSR